MLTVLVSRRWSAGLSSRFRLAGFVLLHEGFRLLDASERHADVAVAQPRDELVIGDGPQTELALGHAFRVQEGLDSRENIVPRPLVFHFHTLSMGEI